MALYRDELEKELKTQLGYKDQILRRPVRGSDYKDVPPGIAWTE